jgi:hypothetical protein
MRRLVLIALGAAACGSGKPPPLPAGPPAALDAQRASADDVVVAQVDGKPVWGSCVAAQAARAHVTRDAALAQCVDFELMAQAAEQRGFAVHHDVVAATHTALVSQLVAQVYEAGFQRPEDFGAFWSFVIERTKLNFKYRHVEYRASTYVRFPIKDAKVDDPQAHANAERVAALVTYERGLTGPQFLAIASQVAHFVVCEPGKYEPCTQDVPLYKIGGLDDAYGDALFALPEVGRATAAIRTSLGWDVIAWTDVEPAAAPSDAELARLELPDVKQAYFETRWVWSRALGNGDVAKALGVHVELDPDADALLEALP